MAISKWFGKADRPVEVPEHLKGADIIIRTSGGLVVGEIKTFTGKSATDATIARMLRGASSAVDEGRKSVVDPQPRRANA